MALAFVARLRRGHPASAGADVSGAVLLTRVIQITGFGGVQTVVLLCRRRLGYRRGEVHKLHHAHNCLLHTGYIVSVIKDKSCR